MISPSIVEEHHPVIIYRTSVTNTTCSIGKAYGYTTVPTMNKRENVQEILANISIRECTSRPKSTTYYNINPNHFKNIIVPGIKQLLGLGLKYCIQSMF